MAIWSGGSDREREKDNLLFAGTLVMRIIIGKYGESALPLGRSFSENLLWF
jgi:hypothetical protein